MSYLRHISTCRLLALVVGCALAIGAGAAAIALAAGGTGTTPPAKPLADAIHDALAAPQPAGVTARIDFTNHLVDAASLQGADPLLTGAKGRLWASGDKLRLELQASERAAARRRAGARRRHAADGHRRRREHRLPDHAPEGRQAAAKRAGAKAVPSVARIQQALTSLATTRPCRRPAGQRRGPARLQRPHLAAPRRRPAGRRRAGVGRRTRRPAARGGLRQRQPQPGPRAAGDRHLLRPRRRRAT